jgi:hypothetical protein
LDLSSKRRQSKPGLPRFIQAPNDFLLGLAL